MFNAKSAFAASLMVLGTLAAGSAHAGNVQWSVSVNLPPVGTVVSSVPVYHAPAPVYHVPAPVYHAPVPVYHAPAPVVVYRPAPPPVVVYRPVPVVAKHGWKHRHHDRHHHYGDRDGRRDEYGDRHRDARWEKGGWDDDGRRQRH